MKRTLGPIALTAIGIGAIIGAGIFSLTGTAAAGQTFASRLETPVINFIQAWVSGTGVVFGRAGAGPAIAASFIVAGIACAFAAFCYAELASMIPVSGSAYTYSYATLGEIVAWIIGWDLILEYAVGNMAVAVSWSGYFVQLCDSLFHLKFPLWLVSDHQTATDLLAKGGTALEAYSSTALPVIGGHSIAFNLPALLIVRSSCLRDSRERAHEYDDRDHQDCSCRVRHRLRSVYGEPEPLASLYAQWLRRPDERRGHRVLRVHRLRRSLDDS